MKTELNKQLQLSSNAAIWKTFLSLPFFPHHKADFPDSMPWIPCFYFLAE